MNILKYIFTVQVDNQNPIRFSNLQNKENEPFFDIEYNITNNQSQGLVQGEISLFNIPRRLREGMLKAYIQTSKRVRISLEISKNINTAPSLVFKGTARMVGVERPNNETTQILFEAFDGGDNVANAISSFKLNKGATVFELKKQYANTLGLDFFSSDVNDGTFLQDGFSSNTKEVLKEMQDVFANLDIFIDGERVFFLDEDYYQNLIKNQRTLIRELTERTGLQVLKPQGNTLNVIHTLLPSIKRSDAISVKSVSNIDNRFNGIYRVVGYQHTGRISYVKPHPNRTNLELRKFDNSPLF